MITKDINKAKEELIRSKLVVIPTETVYGLAGNAFDEIAVKKIFDLKQRPYHNPLIVHIKSAKDLNRIARDIPPTAHKLAEMFWPGPLTLVLDKNSNIPDLVTSGKDTVAVRVPNHKLTLELLNLLDFPLAAPSANPFGSISPTCAEHVHGYFNDQLEIILDGGDCDKGIESTIIGFEGDLPVLYRHGSLAVEDIEKVVGPLITIIHDDVSPNAPGMLSRHYAPKTEIIVTNDVQASIDNNREKRVGVLIFKDRVQNSEIIHQEILSENGDFNEAASKLYNSMHLLDKLNLDLIIAEVFPDEGLGKTINDRLQRATKKE